MAYGDIARRVKIGKDFEVQYIAEKTGIRIEQARRLLERFGSDRGAVERAAGLIKSCPASQTQPAAVDGLPECFSRVGA